MTPSLAAALDRIKLSIRKATYVLAAVAQSHIVDELKISHSSIQREQEKYQEETAKKLKKCFKKTSSSMLFVH